MYHPDGTTLNRRRWPWTVAPDGTVYGVRASYAYPGEVVRIRLCRQGDDFVYVVTTLKRDGRVARVTLEGQSGKIATIR